MIFVSYLFFSETGGSPDTGNLLRWNKSYSKQNHFKRQRK